MTHPRSPQAARDGLRENAERLLAAIDAKDEANIHGWSVALRAVESRGPREVLTAALLRGPGRYSRSGSQALAERLLLALEDAGYVIGEARP